MPFDGVIVDMRMMPRHLQEQAYDVGRFPFVPNDTWSHGWRKLTPPPGHSSADGGLR